MSRTRHLAVIAGDGIGREVMPEGLRAVQAAARRFGLPLEFHAFDWAHCDYYLQHAQALGHDFLADAVSGDDSDLEWCGGGHGRSFGKGAGPSGQKLNENGLWRLSGNR